MKTWRQALQVFRRFRGFSRDRRKTQSQNLIYFDKVLAFFICFSFGSFEEGDRKHEVRFKKDHVESKALFRTVLIWGSRGDGKTYKASFFGRSQVQKIIARKIT